MPQYMLLIRYDNIDLSDYSPEAYQQLIMEFEKWREKLLEKAALLTSGKLKDGEGKTLRLKNDRLMVDGPYCETKEAIAGFFLVTALNEDEAIELSKECPILPIGGSVEVRKLELHEED